ncbi:MAG: type II secretion system protein GspG [Polyangiaceae bacterium]
MMILRRRRAGDRRIFFPWEGRGGLARALRMGRLRPFVLAAVVVGFVVMVGVRERERAGIRQTRATILSVRGAVDSYMALTDGGCPESLEQALQTASFQGSATDAWGRPLRLRCPGGLSGEAYDLMSDGPDGKPGGLDRIR